MSEPILANLGIDQLAGSAASGRQWLSTRGAHLEARSAIDGRVLATLACASANDAQSVIASASGSFPAWRLVPAPRRGEFVRRIGELLRARKEQLAALITDEVGKIPQEALGEVQECIDICEFAVGLSRQLHGLTIASERPAHRLMEQWHPLGVVGVITAFNFPVAVWAWNTMVALVCGNCVIWKPSEKAPLCALACHRLVCDAMAQMPELPTGIVNLLVGRAPMGEELCRSPQLQLISATGSLRMGQAIAQSVAARLGRSLLELGGNNAMIVSQSADLALAVRASVFAAVGTAGQRCTTLRRLIVHRQVKDAMLERLKNVYAQLRIGDPRVPGIHIGPLIDAAAALAMARALDIAQSQGGVVHGGEPITTGVPRGGAYVRPALVEIDAKAGVVQEETFAPILYISTYDSLPEAIAMNNGVPQGLSSSIITERLGEAELFLSPAGSDCGIANVNVGTSGAEIGGAFGGEKQTGGGRESGSDAWKAYMRRATNTINYSHDLPLAQGIAFPT